MKQLYAPPFWILLKHFMRVEFSQRERLITPLFFGAVVLLLFAFTIPELSAELRTRMMVAECLISSFFALQIALSRAFEVEAQDRVFDMIRTSPIEATSFISAKLIHVTVMGLTTLVLTVIAAATFQGFSSERLFSPTTLGLGLLTVVGLASLGVLLAAITLRAQAKQVLFPLLYFPLSTPVLIAASEFLSRYLEKPVWDETAKGWLIMLAAFDVIYLTLAILMGADAVASDS